MSPSPRWRLLIFAASAATLIAGALGIGLLGRPAAPHHGGGAGTGPHLRARAVSGPARPPESPVRNGTGARVVAGRFARAYLRYEVGRLDAATRRELRRDCAAQFGQGLLSDPPRPPPGASEPRERFLGVVGTSPTVLEGRVGVAAVIALGRDGHRARLEVGLARQGGRWAVVEVGP